MQLLATEGAPTRELPNPGNVGNDGESPAILFAELVQVHDGYHLLKLVVGENCVRIVVTPSEFDKLQEMGITTTMAPVRSGW